MDRLDCDRMFVAVLDCGSFAGAAARLGISSGQASKMVARLESELGVQLIKRTTRALSPTEVGEAYHDRVRGLIEEFDAIDAAVRNAASTPAGRLRLSAPVSFGTLQLQPALLDFAIRFPDIQLDVSFADRIVNLVEEGFDAAIRIGHPQDSSLIARRLCDARSVLVAAPAYLASRGRPETLEDLRHHDCIIDANYHDPSHWPFRLPNAQAGVGDRTMIAVSGRLRFSNAQACLAAATAGLGLARVPSFVAGDAIRAGQVLRVLEDMEDQPMGVHALYPPAKHLAHKVRALVDFLAENFHGQPPWDQDWPG